MFMVVVEYLPGASLLHILVLLPASVYEAICRDIHRALEVLQRYGFFSVTPGGEPAVLAGGR